MENVIISREIEIPDSYTVDNFYKGDPLQVDFEVSLYDILEEYDEEKILDELGYDPSMCFKTDFDLKNDKKREIIARLGYMRTKKRFNYPNIFKNLFNQIN